MKKLVLGAALLGPIASGVCLGQTAASPAGQQPTFKAGGEEVVLDVVVRDKHNKPLNDLTAKDFQIFDNGSERAIRSFRLVQGNEAIGVGGQRTPLDPMRQIRLLTLVFDGLDNNGRRLAREAGESLVKNELQSNVFIAVMAIDHSLEAIQPFTNDRELLKKAVDRATSGASTFANDTAQVRTQLEQMVGPNQSGQGTAEQVASMQNGSTAQSGAQGAPSGSASANAAMAQMMLRIFQTTQHDESTEMGRAKIAALLQVVKEQYSLPGRKSILYFTPGFQIPQGMEEPFREVISIANRSNVSFYALDASGLDAAAQNAMSNKELQNSVSASAQNSQRGNVSFENAQSADTAINAGRANVQDTLAILADSTGGTLIANTNDFTGKLKRLTEDLETYYEITYDPGIETYNGAFRKVAVKTDAAGAHVQSRSGYFAIPPSMHGQAVLAAYEVPLLQALSTPPLPRTFGFESAALHFKGTENAPPSCVLVLDVPVGNLTIQEDKASGQYNAQFAYVMLVKDSKGEIVKKIHSEMPLKMDPAKVAAIKETSHFINVQNFDLQPGRYTLESAVLDSDGNRISARKSVFLIPAMPDGSLSMSSVAAIRDMKAKGDTPANDPLLMQNQVVSPMINPTVKKSDTKTMSFYVVIYPAKASNDKPILQMEFSKDGQVLGAGAPPLGKMDDQGRIQYVATVPLEQLPAGSYQVRFVAKQGAQAADESVSFSVQ